MPLQNQIVNILHDKHKQNHLSLADRESRNPRNRMKNEPQFKNFQSLTRTHKTHEIEKQILYTQFQ